MLEIESFAYELGFDDFGIADARTGTPTSSAFDESLEAERHGPLAYLIKTKEERRNVLALMPSAKSVIVVAKNYYTGDHEDHVSQEQIAQGAKVSRYAWGRDYHHWFKKRLRKMRNKLLELSPGAEVHIFNDTGPVLERAWAQKAGLGFIGKSSMFIHRKFGTWVFLGGMVTSIDLESKSVPPSTMCGSCTRCIDACPTGAIIAPFKVDARRCLTTWNVEKPQDPQAENPEFGAKPWAIGCDICQEVCPWNKFERRTLEPRFLPRKEHVVLTSAPTGDLSGTPLARPGHLGIAKTLLRISKQEKEWKNKEDGQGKKD